MLVNVLKSLGLSSMEANVYMAALRTGQAKTSAISARAGLSRSTGYNVLNSLYRKGLVSRSDKAKVQYFSPVPPKDLVDFLKKNEEELRAKAEMVKTYLPQFEAVYNRQNNMPKVQFFDGVSGIKQVYMDILKSGQKETFAALSWGDVSDVSLDVKDWVQNVFTKKKIKKGMFSKVLVSSKNPKSYTKLDKKHLRQSLVIPHEKYPFAVEIDVYDENKTAFISFDESEMMGVIIESPKIASTLKSLFKLVWDKSK
ncbi:MAG: helix-turn-helix domain-containing protein [Candidatus Gracilibacteria bacterium]|jgi:sugar-specific transcriptional regulator TrmB